MVFSVPLRCTFRLSLISTPPQVTRYMMRMERSKKIETNLFFLLSFLLLMSSEAATSSGSSSSRLRSLGDRIRDVGHECTDEGGTSEEEMFEVVDCSEKGARWDYAFQVVEKSHRRDQEEGKKKGVLDAFSAILSFAPPSAEGGRDSRYKFGFRHKKCIRVTEAESISSIQGKFVDDKIPEGRVIIERTDKTVSVGRASRNRLSGIVRHFAKGAIKEDLKLSNITDAKGNVLFTRDPFGYFILHRDSTSSSSPIVLTKDFSLFYSCDDPGDGQNLSGCLEMEIIGDDKDQEKCLPNMETARAMCAGGRGKKKLNLASERQFDQAEWEQICQSEKKGSDIRHFIENWLSSITNQMDPFWIQDPDPNPLSEDRGFSITLDQFRGRDPFSKVSVSLETMSGEVLFEGVMVDGTLKGIADEDKAHLFRYPLGLYLIRKIPRLTIVTETQQRTPLMSGRLSKGLLNGPVRMYGRMSTDPRGACSGQIEGVELLSFVGNYRDGRPSGRVWRGLIGGAWLHGEVDVDGELTGDRIAYVYPDFRTAFVGRFERGIMIEAKEAEVISARCGDDDGIMRLEFSEPSGGPAYRYKPPSADSFGDQPLVGDPIENRYLYLNPSKEMPEAGESAYAREDIPANTTFALISGHRLNKEEMTERSKAYRRELSSRGITDSAHPEAVDKWKYRITVSLCDMTLDLPSEFGNTERFRSTLGHKVNHRFDTNSEFLHIDSARHGIIMSVRTMVDVKKDEEFSVNYGYSKKIDLPWYREARAKFDGGKMDDDDPSDIGNKEEEEEEMEQIQAMSL